ncbi:hypothetical protein BC832DRAFT_541490 [Gaertneriomyces semiglobifer]|nr:hypothetical protein BC832DRAFT_541490 [Gaertneriomyces semiglobifer]
MDDNALQTPLLFNRSLASNPIWDITQEPQMPMFTVKGVQITATNPAPRWNDIQERIFNSLSNNQQPRILLSLSSSSLTPLFTLQTLLSAALHPPVPVHPVHSNKEVRDVISRVVAGHVHGAMSETVYGKVLENVDSLEECAWRRDRWVSVLGAIGGMTAHDCFVIQDGLGTFANIAQASISELRNCSVDKETALAVREFWDEETIA